ncbi:MAG: L-serine ammonia-lyase, iron-sulfur-dependent, subunit alpha [Chloroflexota bacterium]
MRAVSILNDVLGPVMRGPSSSHTAGSFHIGRLARDLLGEDPTSATFVFDPGGSLAEVYRQQGSDVAFTAGLIGVSMVDERFASALDVAADRGVRVSFVKEPLREADHPNAVEIRLQTGDGRRLDVAAKSVGGGAVVVTRVGEWPVRLTGDAYEVLIVADRSLAPAVRQRVTQGMQVIGEPTVRRQGNRALVHVRLERPPDDDLAARLPEAEIIWTAAPIFFVPLGEPLFLSAAEMVSLAERRHLSLGRAALAYESALLGLPEESVLAEVNRRFGVMRAAVQRGLEADLPPMQLLHPTAHRIYAAEAEGRLAVGGIHTRAAARAMAVMHVNGGMGLICAAPTAGSAGVIPGTVVTLVDERKLGGEQAALALLAASAIGLVIATRGTFAAEVAGCQVEIGAAGAMASAAVVEAAGGSVQQAVDAAAISLQNTMGSICDLVQGVVEIPCHTRNGVAASSAFVCADLILGGYVNPIPLDETIDAAVAAGRMLPRELRCTALGGIATTPSALCMPRLS